MSESSSRVSLQISSGDELPVCEYCGGSPCEWDEWGLETIDATVGRFQWTQNNTVLVDENCLEVSRSFVRKTLYQLFTYVKYRHLGRGNRIPIPTCVEREIRQRYPEPNGEYMNFMDE